MRVKLSAVHGLVIVFAVVIGAPMITGKTFQSPDQSKNGKRIERVASMSELRAKTDEDLAAAVFYDVYGQGALRPGADRRLSPGERLSQPPPGAPLPTFEEFLSGLVCSTDAIVIGKATATGVVLNRRQTFLFTKYDITVSKWVHPRERGAPHVKISAPGGEAMVGAQLTRAQASAQPDGDRDYLFLLEHIPGAGRLSLLRRPITEDTSWYDLVTDRILPARVPDRVGDLNSLAERFGAASRTCKGRRNTASDVRQLPLKCC